MASTRFWFDSAIAAFSGVLLACAFPQPGFSFVAWFALIPLILVMERRPLLSGYVAGTAFFAITLYWLNIVMVTYGRLHPLLSLVAYFILVGYLALFFAVVTWLVCRLRERLEYPPALTMPVVWVALELIRSVFLTGFPWVLLGYSQQDNLNLIQSADLFGVYGISALVVMANCVAASFISWFRNRSKRFRQGRYALILLLLLVANAGYGTFRQESFRDEGPSLELAVIQGNIDQTIKWAPENQVRTIKSYRQLSEIATQDGVDLIIWPESATPFYLQDRSALQSAVLEVPRSSGAHLLTGSPSYFRKDDGRYSYFNSAFMVSPTGVLADRSDKVHLVPFGEYVPFGQFLPFVDKMVYGIGDFSAGDVRPIALNGRKFGVLICYEAIFPELARAYVNMGSTLLINITNDAWFGNSSAPYQHLAMARFRAIENRRWMARAANTGISAVIDPLGVVKARTELFEKATINRSINLLSGVTFYSRFGDLFPLLFLLASIVWIWQSRLRK